MVFDVNQNYCGDHFTVNINIESSCYILETNVILCLLYLNKNNNMKIRQSFLQGIYPLLGKKDKNKNVMSCCVVVELCTKFSSGMIVITTEFKKILPRM